MCCATHRGTSLSRAWCLVMCVCDFDGVRTSCTQSVRVCVIFGGVCTTCCPIVFDWPDDRTAFSELMPGDVAALDAELNGPGADRERSPGQQMLRDHQWFGTQKVAAKQGCACVIS